MVMKRLLTKGTLIHIMVAGRPSVPGGAGADGFPVHWVGVTVGAFVAGVADTSIFQVTKQTCHERYEGAALVIYRGHQQSYG